MGIMTDLSLRLSANTANLTTGLSSATQSLNTFGTNAQNAARNITNSFSSINSTNSSIKEMRMALNSLKNVSFAGKSKEEIAAINQQIGHLRDEMRKLDQQQLGTGAVSSLGKINNSAISLTSVAGMLGGAIAAIGVGAAIKGLISNAITVRTEFSKYEAVLTNTLGSQKAMNESFAMLKEFAATTPFQLTEVTDAYVKLVNQGFKPTQKEMILLGDLASSQGKSFNQLAEAVLDAQNGENERLKEFGIKAKKEGDVIKYTFKGVTTEVDNNADAIRNYVLSLGGLQGVAGGMAAISKTIGGAISNAGDATDAFFNSVGEKLEPAIVRLSSTYSNLLKTLETSIKGGAFDSVVDGANQAVSDIDDVIYTWTNKNISTWQAIGITIDKALWGSHGTEFLRKQKLLEEEIAKTANSKTVIADRGANLKRLNDDFKAGREVKLDLNTPEFKQAQAELKQKIQLAKQKADKQKELDDKILEASQKAANKQDALDKKILDARKKAIKGGDLELINLKYKVGGLDIGVNKIKTPIPDLDMKGIDKSTGRTSSKASLGQFNLDKDAGAWAKLKANIKATQFLTETFSKSIDGVTDAFTGLFEGSTSGFKDVVTSMIQGIQTIINGLLAQAVAAMIAKESTKGLLGLATAAVGVSILLGLWKSQVPAFANGGIVGGSSYSGDKVPIMANSGEMILNGSQQAKLFSTINNGSTSNGNVLTGEVIVRGSDIAIALTNYNHKKNRTR